MHCLQWTILFKLIVVLFLRDIAFFRRTSLEILNSLKLRYSNGGNTAITKISTLSALGMILSFLEITFKLTWKVSNIARRVSSLRLVTDVR